MNANPDPAAFLAMLPDDVLADIRAVVGDPGEMRFRHHRRRLNDLLDRAMQLRKVQP